MSARNVSRSLDFNLDHILMATFMLMVVVGSKVNTKMHRTIRVILEVIWGRSDSGLLHEFI